MKYVAPGPLLRALLRPRIEGLDKLPDQGPVIVAANHLSPFDPFLLSLVTPRRITFLAKKEYFETPGLKGLLTRWLFLSQRQVSTDRRGTIGGLTAVDEAVGLLGEGKVFGVFPEGTRGRPGHLYRGHTGVAQASFRTGVPVHPVTVAGTYEITVGKVLRRALPPVRIRIGDPVAPPADRKATSPRELRRFTTVVMAAVAELGGLVVQETFAPGRGTPPPPSRGLRRAE